MIAATAIITDAYLISQGDESRFLKKAHWTKEINQGLWKAY